MPSGSIPPCARDWPQDWQAQHAVKAHDASSCRRGMHLAHQECRQPRRQCLRCHRWSCSRSPGPGGRSRSGRYPGRSRSGPAPASSRGWLQCLHCAHGIRRLHSHVMCQHGAEKTQEALTHEARATAMSSFLARKLADGPRCRSECFASSSTAFACSRSGRVWHSLPGI